MAGSDRILACDACKWCKIGVVCAVAAETLESGLLPLLGEKEQDSSSGR